MKFLRSFAFAGLIGLAVAAPASVNSQSPRRYSTAEIERFQASCEAGDVRACSIAGAYYADINPTSPWALADFRKGCSLRDAAACAAAADVLRRTPPASDFKPEVIDYYKKGCDLGDRNACDTYGAAQAVAAVAAKRAQAAQAQRTPPPPPPPSQPIALSAADMACLKQTSESYETTEQSDQCASFAQVNGVRQCAIWNTKKVAHTRIVETNVCRAPIRYRIQCGQRIVGGREVAPGGKAEINDPSGCSRVY